MNCGPFRRDIVSPPLISQEPDHDGRVLVYGPEKIPEISPNLILNEHLSSGDRYPAEKA